MFVSMKTYKTTALITLYGGEIGLTEDQAAPRRRRLEGGRKGIYTILKPVKFKAGEVIRLPEAPKVLMRSMIEWQTGKPAPQDGAQ
jgi:hypothetical protein